MKREFEFNISASLDFDLDANSSQSLHQMSQSIMSEISSELQVFQKLSGPLAYIGLVLLACSFLRSDSSHIYTLGSLNLSNVQQLHTSVAPHSAHASVHLIDATQHFKILQSHHKYSSPP